MNWSGSTHVQTPSRAGAHCARSAARKKRRGGARRVACGVRRGAPPPMAPGRRGRWTRAEPVGGLAEDGRVAVMSRRQIMRPTDERVFFSDKTSIIILGEWRNKVRYRVNSYLEEK